MNRIDTILSELKVSGKKMLSPYITAGDPHPNLTVNIMHALVEAGADVLELGIPFSDPMAEGPVIQHAMERALSHNIRCQDVLEMVKEFRKQDQHTALILMSYVNPLNNTATMDLPKRLLMQASMGPFSWISHQKKVLRSQKSGNNTTCTTSICVHPPLLKNA